MLLERAPLQVSQQALLQLVKELNANPSVHGILVQLPLPDHIDEEAILTAISLEKDVDGFHPENIGKLAMKGREPLFAPCTPKGCIELLDRSGVAISGANAVVIGRSNIVGIPAAMLLLGRSATVTICHSRTKDIEAKVRDADIVVAAVGRRLRRGASPMLAVLIHMIAALRLPAVAAATGVRQGSVDLVQAVAAPVALASEQRRAERPRVPVVRHLDPHSVRAVTVASASPQPFW